jgi:hypothetical protein
VRTKLKDQPEGTTHSFVYKNKVKCSWRVCDLNSTPPFRNPDQPSTRPNSKMRNNFEGPVGGEGAKDGAARRKGIRRNHEWKLSSEEFVKTRKDGEETLSRARTRSRLNFRQFLASANGSWFLSATEIPPLCHHLRLAFASAKRPATRRDSVSTLCSTREFDDLRESSGTRLENGGFDQEKTILDQPRLATTIDTR